MENAVLGVRSIELEVCDLQSAGRSLAEYGNSRSRRELAERSIFASNFLSALRTTWKT